MSPDEYRLVAGILCSAFGIVAAVGLVVWGVMIWIEHGEGK